MDKAASFSSLYALRVHVTSSMVGSSSDRGTGIARDPQPRVTVSVGASGASAIFTGGASEKRSPSLGALKRPWPTRAASRQDSSAAGASGVDSRYLRTTGFNLTPVKVRHGGGIRHTRKLIEELVESNRM